ncbi:hypothetical protein HJD18_03695 [Thermoleophilia bacterium SCSIO 60948]|nr:hypothetical protein HJD18_03695 [Thermoleophilia bacterium SCSIO 60948]
MSLTVAEGPEGRCVGRRLLTRLIGGARRAGIETFFVSCPVSSRHTIELLWEFGAEVRELGREGGIVEFEVSLPKLLEPSAESSR